MVSVNKILDLGALYGFKPSERLGFVGMNQITEDNVEQRLDIFQWCNPTVAARDGIPNSYLVVCLTLGGFLEDGGRWRLPLVWWPSDTQAIRPWEDVIAEFDVIFAPLFNSPYSIVSLEERFRLF